MRGWRRFALLLLAGVTAACHPTPPSIPDQARLYGRQGDTKEAAQVTSQLDTAWARSDVKPGSSCYCATGA